MFGWIKKWLIRDDFISMSDFVIKSLYRRRKSLHIIMRIVALFEACMLTYGLIFFDLSNQRLRLYIALYSILLLASLFGDLYMLYVERDSDEQKFVKIQGLAYVYFVLVIAWGVVISTLDVMHGGSYWVAMTVIMAVCAFMTLNPIVQCLYIAVVTTYIAIFDVSVKGEIDAGIINIFLFGVILCTIILRNFKTSYNEFYLEKQLTDLSVRDGLTSIYNRRALEKFILFGDTGPVKCVSVVSVEEVKKSDEGREYKIRDEALLLVAMYIREQFDDREIYCYGGDEFLVLSEKTADETLERLKRINAKIDESDNESGFCIYGGIAPVKDDVAETIERADSVLYDVKKKKEGFFAIEK